MFMTLRRRVAVTQPVPLVVSSILIYVGVLLMVLPYARSSIPHLANPVSLGQVRVAMWLTSGGGSGLHWAATSISVVITFFVWMRWRSGTRSGPRTLSHLGVGVLLALVQLALAAMLSKVPIFYLTAV